MQNAKCKLRTATALCASYFLVAGSFLAVHAQFQMPDPKQMSGIPRPVTDLPDGTVSVRLIRGQLSNNITNFPVELHVGSRVQTVKTDDGGRAQFSGLHAGDALKAVAVVDGERLESEEFPAPAQGGIRLMLVATDKSAAPATELGAPPVTGQLVLGSQSRIVLEPGDGVVSVYYVLEVLNNARAPINPREPFVLEMPAGSVGTALLEGSSPQSSVDGARVRVRGPFSPGRTLVRVATEVPETGGSLELVQRFPANLEQLAVIVKKVGETKLSSSQLLSQQEMTASGELFIAASGGAVAAGQPLVLTLEGMPHHSGVPRWTALSLALLIVLVGVFAAGRTDRTDVESSEQKRLVTRREKLLSDLVRLEREHRAGKVSPDRFASRREELVAALEHVYGALDRETPGPDEAGRAA